MIVSNLERTRRTSIRPSESGHPATRRHSKRHLNRSSRAAVRQDLRDRRTW